jgi:hypothetical protein
MSSKTKLSKGPKIQTFAALAKGHSGLVKYTIIPSPDTLTFKAIPDASSLAQGTLDDLVAVGAVLGVSEYTFSCGENRATFIITDAKFIAMFREYSGEFQKKTRVSESAGSNDYVQCDSAGAQSPAQAPSRVQMIKGVFDSQSSASATPITLTPSPPPAAATTSGLDVIEVPSTSLVVIIESIKVLKVCCSCNSEGLLTCLKQELSRSRSQNWALQVKAHEAALWRELTHGQLKHEFRIFLLHAFVGYRNRHFKIRLLQVLNDFASRIWASIPGPGEFVPIRSLPPSSAQDWVRNQRFQRVLQTWFPNGLDMVHLGQVLHSRVKNQLTGSKCAIRTRPHLPGKRRPKPASLAP